MFGIRPYRETPSIGILYDGSDPAEGMPAAIKMEDGYAFIDATPPDRPSLTSPEATVLALTSIGMGECAIGQRLERWYGDPKHITAIDSLTEKLDQSGLGTKASMVATAFEHRFLLPEKAPQSSLEPDLHQDFFHLTALLGADYTIREIAEALDRPADEIRSALGSIALDLDFTFMEHPSTALVTLAGMGSVLPFKRHGSLSELMVPLTPTHEQLLRGHNFDFQPYGEDSHISIRFTNQSAKRPEPDMRQGTVDQIAIGGALIHVNDGSFIDDNNEMRQLTTPEIKFLALKSIGYSDKDAAAALGISLYVGITLYDKLMPNRPRKAGRTIEPAIYAAFDKGIFTSTGRASLPLTEHWRKRFFAYTDGAAKGWTNEQIGKTIDVSEGGISFVCSSLQEKLDIRGTASLVLMAMTHRSRSQKKEAQTLAVPVSQAA